MTKDPPSVPALVALLKACSKHGDLERGRRIHSSLLATPLGCRLASSNAYVRSSLVSMYAKCGALSEARQLVLDPQISPHHHVVVSWNALITGYAQHGHGEEALRCYEQMKEEGIPPTAVTYVSTLKACGSIGAKEKGEEIHDEVTKARLLDANVLVGNALLDMYAKCGDLTKARQIFRGLCIRDVVSWNTMISGYVQCGYSEEALRCYRQMRREQVPPNTVTFLCTLKACGTIGAATKGEKLHAKILRHGLLKRNSLLGTALVDMYAKCGSLEKAQDVFDQIPTRDVIAWTALIGGYAQHGLYEKALDCFDSMQQDSISPNVVTFVCMLKACGSIGAADRGKEIHDEIMRAGLLKKNLLVGTALVDMYAKLGDVMEAHKVFDELQLQDLECWNAIISGYGQCGEHDMVVSLFNKLIEKGMVPNQVTFNIVLNACSHSGLLDTGQLYFHIMSSFYGLMPTLEHYTCMVDLFARAGFFDKALTIIHKMPKIPDYFPVWTALLGACQKWGHVMLGKVAFRNALGLDEKNSALYAGMRNIYMLTAT